MSSKQDIIETIVIIEWEMFRSVESAAPASCQNSPESFRGIRASIYEEWPEPALESYLRDLIRAREEERNLVSEKYARMDNLLPPLKENPLIEDIVRIEADWQEEIRNKYPMIYRSTCRTTDPADDGGNFSVYLRSELETYGDKTIELYHEHVKRAEANHDNLSLRMLERLVKKSGYEDLENAEKQLRG